MNTLNAEGNRRNENMDGFPYCSHAEGRYPKGSCLKNNYPRSSWPTVVLPWVVVSRIVVL